ncbi:MAG: hypothetical protein ACW98F_19370, partial [Candidatus Hodarchaeales archaeon]
EVYLKIFYTSGNWEYLSAPLGTPIELMKVKTIELNIICTVGNDHLDVVFYRALVNAHCVYEIIG